MNAKNITLNIDDTTMHAIQFGRGHRHLIMIPGLGDGLTTVKGLALPLSLMYRNYGMHYRVTVLSRRNVMKADHDTKQMAMDVKEAMDQLMIDKADVFGISQGGMIAQYLAVFYPERVNRLVLAVTASKGNAWIDSCIDRWSKMALRKDMLSLMKDNVMSMYTKQYCKKYLWLTQITGRIKPKSFDRFLIMANACKYHNAFERLTEIHCPVLIMAGQNDQVVGVDASFEIAHQIPHAQLKVYPNYGHAVYDEAKDFHDDVLNFLIKE